MYPSNSPKRTQPYPWAGSPNRVSGPSTHDVTQPAHAYAQWPHNAAHPSSSGPAGDLTAGSYPPAALYAETYSYDASHPHANTAQVYGNFTPLSSIEGQDSRYHAQASVAPRSYTTQNDMSTAFGGDTQYNPPTTMPSTSPRGSRTATETVPGHSTTYGHYPENNIIRISPYQPPSTLQPELAESSKSGNKCKSRKDTTKAAPKASQPAPAFTAPVNDDSDQEHATKKKKKMTDEEKRRRKALQAQFYRAQNGEAVRDLEDVLPEAYKTHDDPLGRETIVRGVKYIKDMPAVHERNVELSHELEQRNLELRIVKKERDDARGFLQATRNELNLSKLAIIRREKELGRLQDRVKYLESMLAGPQASVLKLQQE
ncbi:hypothetical protein DENSPDRAFT_884489 [Dentipellis sp. KUC8613]|nr:hypothetical protein DENSPDRAFT_884489 [Dentipellis sp. KUC8613]